MEDRNEEKIRGRSRRQPGTGRKPQDGKTMRNERKPQDGERLRDGRKTQGGERLRDERKLQDGENLRGGNMPAETGRKEGQEYRDASPKPDLSKVSAYQKSSSSAGKKAFLIKAAAAAAVLVIAAGGIGGFWFMKEAGRYETVFFPMTTINGIDASKKTVEEIKAAIASQIDGYSLEITGRDGKTETITKEEIGLHSEFDGSLENMLDGQNPKEWFKHTKDPAVFEIKTMIAYDEEKLEKRLNQLGFMDETAMTPPQDARISDYDSSIKGYSIVPAVQGTTVDQAAVKDAVSGAIMNLKTELDLDAENCYIKPAVEADDADLAAALAKLNQYTGAVVTHTFGNSKEVLDGDRIHQWLTVNGVEVSLDTSQVAAYVKELASKYNTAYKSKTLKTSYGNTVTITGGNYGWRINQDKETAAVTEIIKAGEQQTREPEYSQKAASHGANDYGDTYVEINLTAQHIFFYKDGKLLVESDLVSGNESKGWSTPAGAYPLTYKQRDATLTGEDYKTPVSYWMPFNGGIGLHDATWRSSFGGELYKNGGSHGCVNLPPSVAKTIYENISAGMPVLCYHLDGTGSKKTSTSSGKPVETKPAETTAAPTTAPAETTPAETAPETSAQGPSVPGETGTSGGESQPAETPAPPVETTPETTAETKAPAGPGFVEPGQEATAGEAAGPGF